MMQTSRKTRRALATMVVGIFCSAASAQVGDREVQSFLAGKPASLQPGFKKLFLEGSRNSVKNLLELGTTAIAVREYSIAQRAFEAATARIGSIRSEDAAANTAKSNFSLEAAKEFKGEPYERVMAFYYYGLLLARQGDFQNARAAFLSAEQQDTIAENEKYAGDFWLMRLLAGWASHCDGDSVKAAEFLDDVKRNTGPALAAAPSRFPNTLALYEQGVGPVKQGTGKYKETLTFNDAAPVLPNVVANATLSDGTAVGKSIPAMEVADTFFQASTRGGRPIQGILDGKVAFKDGAGVVAQVGGIAGSAAMMSGIANNNRGMANLGGAFALVGLFANIAAQAATPSADLRGWGGLPKRILWADLDDMEAAGQVRLHFVDDAGKRSGARKLVDHGKCVLLWGRAAETWSAAGSEPLDPLRTKYFDQARDDQMRQELASTFAQEAK